MTRKELSINTFLKFIALQHSALAKQVRFMFSKKQIGQLGEKLAAQYLREQGFKIIALNYQTKHGEIDIVCRKDKITVFVEVKTRTSNICGLPEEAITKTKATHLINSAFEYLIQNPGPWQIDLVTVEILSSQPTIIKHWPQIIDETIYY